MLDKNDHDQDKEWHEETIQEPDIYELGVGGGRQALGYGAFQGVHYEQGRDRKWDGRLEVFFIEINRSLKKGINIVQLGPSFKSKSKVWTKAEL